jgi:hypothetical protein
VGDVAFGVDVKDERTIRVPVPTDAGTTEQFGKFLLNNAQEGYTLVRAHAIERGQRDPLTVGVEVTVAR